MKFDEAIENILKEGREFFTGKLLKLKKSLSQDGEDKLDTYIGTIGDDWDEYAGANDDTGKYMQDWQDSIWSDFDKEKWEDKKDKAIVSDILDEYFQWAEKWL